MKNRQSKLKAWVTAMRLRTLPLALSSIGMGAFLSAAIGKFDWTVLLLTIITVTCIQVLSNFANDYGDHFNGADTKDRVGPARMVQSGAILPKEMKRGMVVMVIISLFLGVLLLRISLGFGGLFILYFLLGISAIVAAIKYTTGKNPYGYNGLGDVFVFVFFGWVGVLGTFYLMSNEMQWSILLPATSCSVFAVAVLNLNNMRDRETDENAGKRTLPVRFGKKWATNYHILLLLTGVSTSVLFVWFSGQTIYQLFFLLTIPLLYKNAQKVLHYKNPQELDPYLKQMALTSLLFVLLFGIGQFVFTV